jgi:hypothetical protein
MTGYLIVAAVMILLGMAVGLVAVVSVAGRVDKDVTVPPPNRFARGARAASGLHYRPGPYREAASCRHDLPRPGEWPRGEPW